MTAPTRWIVGNLDVEARVARRRLPTRILSRLSAAATLLRAFAGPEDGLWTPLPVDPLRIPAAAGLPRPELATGEAALPGSEDGHLFWCGEAARPFLSRAVDVALMSDLGLLRPGTRLLHSAADLDDALAAHGQGDWVLKPLLSAAGRGQVHGHGRRLADGTPAADAPAVRRLLDPAAGQTGGALLEPWVSRTADFGALGEIRDDGAVELLGSHRALVDGQGAFRGIELTVDGRPPPDLRDTEHAALTATARRAGDWLAARGLRGPFGIDAFRYRRDGGEAFNPLCELNPRLSFGRVARALVDRVAPHAGWRPADTVRLQFGKGSVPGAADVSLLAADPGGRDDTCAWLLRT